LALVSLLLAAAAPAVTRYVWKDNPNTPVPPYTGGWASAATNIQDAVDVAAVGDTVLVTNGVYDAGGRVAPGDATLKTRLIITNAITVISVNGPDSTLIVGQPHASATGLGDTAVRGVYLTNNAVLAGFTVSNGFTRGPGTAATASYVGGGIRCDNAAALVSNCVIVANAANARGGGVHFGTLVDCVVVSNAVLGTTSTSAGGGGVYQTVARRTRIERNWTQGSSMDGGGAYGGALTDCIVVSNTAARNGGGAYASGLTNCTLEANFASNSGGGAYTAAAATNTVFRGNTAVTSGGGVYQGFLVDCQIVSNRVTSTGGDGGGFYGSAAGHRLLGCLVLGNETPDLGGGVYNAALSNCVVRGNRATGASATTGSGGGVYATAVTYPASRCYILDNEANYRGGGAYQGAFYSCVFSGNSASEGAGAYLYSTTYLLNSCTVAGNFTTNKYGGVYNGTIKNSIIYGNTARVYNNYTNTTSSAITYTCAYPLPPGTGNTAAEPQLTGYRDPHLLPGSPLIGAGLAEAWMAVAADIDGDERAPGGVTDIGADQHNPSGLTGPLSVAIVPETNVCVMGVALGLRAEAEGRVGGIVWDFGDGTGAEGANPVSHAFATAGVYTVKATVTNATDAAFATVEIQVIAYVRYVSPNGSHTPPFDTWEKAATNIQAAVDAVEIAGGLVLVTNGVYDVGARVAGGQATTNRLALDKAVRVESVNGPAVTAIAGRWHSEAAPLGAAALRCVYIGAGATLCGFTVSNGATAYSTAGNNGRGGGLFVAAGGLATNCVIAGCRAWSGGGASGASGSGGELRGCEVRNNLALNAGSNNRGGGVADLTLVGCTVASNTAYNGGGAYMCALDRCALTANASTSQGGGAYDCTLNDCELRGNVATNNAGGGAYYGTLTRCRLYDNTSTGSSYGGGAYDATLYSCVLSGNTASRGGGAYGTSAGKGMYNCTVVGNTATIGSPNAGGGGVYCGSASYPIRNCILYYNEASVSNNLYWGAVTYSCAAPLQTGTGNIDAAPLIASFKRPTLLASSPCVGAGLVEEWMAGAFDFEGEPRTAGGLVDIGADQQHAEGLSGELTASISGSEWPYYPGVAYTFTADVSGHPTVLHWDFGDGEGASNVPQVAHAWPEGVYTIRLTVSNATHSAQATLELDVAPDTRYVSPSGSHTPPFRTWATAATNLQAAADAVLAGGRVKVAAGVYDAGGRAASGETVMNRLLVDKAITVTAVDGPEATFIVGAASGAPVTNGLGDGTVRGVRLAAGAALQGFTVTGGRTRWHASAITPDYVGGGIFCENGTAVVAGCIVSNNAAANEGGGIYYGKVLNTTVAGNGLYGGSANYTKGGGIHRGALVSNCVIRANVTAGSGGGAYGCDLVADTLFDGNESTVGGGGGYFAYEVGAPMWRCVVVNNRSATFGGGVVGAAMTDCVLTNNESATGGGYYASSSFDADVIRCRIEGNRATGEGGGAYRGRLYASRIIGNSAGSRAGGIYYGTIYSCAVAGNRAGTIGGGTYFTKVEASTVTDNEARDYGGGCYAGTAYFSIIYHNRAETGPEYRNTTSYGCCTTPFEANVTYGPITATPQISGRSDPHLLAGSPCIDSGDYRTWFQEANGFDLDGEARYGVPLYDIGADERYDTALTGAVAVAVAADRTLIGPDYAPQFWADCLGRVGELTWDFGDGTGATNVNPVVHAFPGVGEYIVRATASNLTDGAFAELAVSVVEGAVYVAPNGGHQPPFATWATAATNIQDAIDEAVWGGTVWVSNGVYASGVRANASGGWTNRVCIEKAVRVRGVAGPAATVIRGAWHDAGTPCGPNAVRGVFLGHAQARLEGVTIADGATDTDWSGDGGGVYCASPDARVIDCVITNCIADDEGGGAFGGTLIGCQILGNLANWGGGGVSQSSLSNCVVSGNASPDGYGGGAYLCVFTACALNGNEAYDGGGAYDGVLEGCALAANRAYYGGGAEEATLVACDLSDNTAYYGGGVFYSECEGCSFVGNKAQWGGGSYDALSALCTYTANVATNSGGGAYYGYLEDCLLQSNLAIEGDGGGFATTYSFDGLSACTIVNNTAGMNGGGCYRGKLYDCLLTNNAAQNGGAYYAPLVEAGGEIYRGRLWDNRAAYDGGGAYGGALYSSVLAGNSAGESGGAAYESKLESCTACGNRAGAQAGGCQGGLAYNSILYYNRAPWGENNVDTVQSRCCVPGGFVSAAPRLSGFYQPHLLPQSPCVDAGLTRTWMESADGLDMEQDGRLLGSQTDIGADEVTGTEPDGELTVALHAETLSIAAAYAQTFRAEVDGTPAGMLWDFGDGVCATNRNPVDHAFAATGLYTVRVTATNATHNAYAELQVTVVNSDVFVATGGAHVAPFATWETAATNIQDAVNQAPFGGTVWVGDGIYDVGGRPAAGYAQSNRVCVLGPVTVRSVNGPSAATIRGAWQDAETPCGPQAVRGVYLGHPEARLFGFTITGGATAASGVETDGGGILSRYAASVVSNCVVEGCVADSDGGGGWGGTWLDCRLAGNLADDGGGAYAAQLSRCAVDGNRAYWYGGGVFGGSATDSEIVWNEVLFGDGGGGGLAYCDAMRCTLRANSSEGVAGGALGGTLVNCAVFDNTAALVGGVSHADLYNCTVSANEASLEVGGADSCDVVNSIIWGNAAPVVSNANYCVFRYSLTAPPPSGEYDLGGNLSEDPQFVNPAVFNFRLRGTSPCVNAGTNLPLVVGSTDLDGEARFNGNNVDMGAYEYVPVEGYAAMGTPVSWLELYFAGPDWDAIELDDPDQDGFLTWQEYIALTDPTDESSFFAIRDVSFGASGAEVSFDTALGRVYTVQHTPGLNPQAWSNASSPVTGTGGRVTVAVPDAASTYFYRVRVSLP